MTQITQLHTKKHVCVNLRDLRENLLSALTSRAITSGLTYHLAASCILHPASCKPQASSPGTETETETGTGRIETETWCTLMRYEDRLLRYP